MNALRNTTEVTKFLGQVDYEAGKDTKFEITKYQGRQLITVSPDRLRTDIVMSNAGNGGYSWASTSEVINFMIVAKSAVMHVVKYEKVRVIGGEANLAARGFDGYTVFARIYHDVFVPDNKRLAIYVNTESSDPPQTAELDIKFGANNKIQGITVFPGDKMYLVGIDAGTTSEGATTYTAVGSKINANKFTAVRTGDTITSAAHLCAIDSDRTVVAVQTAPTLS